MFNLWLVIGKFVHGGGKAEKLPLRTDGCLANSTLIDLPDLNLYEIETQPEER